MKLKDNPIIFLLTRLWKYSKGNRKWVITYISFFVIANSVAALFPLVIAKLLNVIQEQGLNEQSLPKILFYLLLFFLIEILFWSFHGPARIIENKNAFLARANYKQYLLRGVMELPIEWHVNHHSGDTIDKIEKGTTALYRFSKSTFEIVQAVIRLVTSYIVLAYFNHYSAIIVLVIFVFTITLITRFDKIIIRQYKVLNRTENQISEKIFDSISNITTVIILRIEELVASSIFKKIMSPLSLFVKNSRVNETKWFLVSLCSSFMTILVLATYFYANLHAGTAILVGTVYALYGYVDRISEIFFRFAYMYGEIVLQKTSVLNAEEISEHFTTTKEMAKMKLPESWKSLKISNLSFSYDQEKNSDLHLDNVSIEIKNGARIALIGESGSGKTTLLKIIRELYRPQKVKVSIDGQTLRNGFEEISHDIALIPQDPEIFTTTIKENITMGVNHSADYIKKFTDMACVSDVIENLPNKMDSNIYEKGVNLSGGEKQRLALARGLMACEDKSIVLLDEPTSSVDTQNELRIFQNIFREFEKKSVIASVHRLHLLRLFDEIYFFKDGEVIASGTFNKLLKSSPEFNEIWDKYQTSTTENQ